MKTHWSITMKNLDINDLENIMLGAQILGCGGGGEIGWGLSMLKGEYDRGGRFCLSDIADAPDDDLLFIVGAVGGGIEEEDVRKTESYLAGMTFRETFEMPAQWAVDELSEYYGSEPAGFIPTEIGAGNMAVALFTAAKKSKYVIDGDCCGRAKPMISISTTRIAGILPTPLAAVSPMGDVMVLKKAVDDCRAEDILRRFAVSSGGACLCARCPAMVGKYKNGMVAGSFSRCLELGEKINQVKNENADLIEKVRESEPQADFLFKGIIHSHERTEEGGFITGWLRIDGTEEYARRYCDVWFKNEFAALYLDDTLKERVPDSIVIINERTLMGVSNWADTGDRVHDPVLVFKIPAVDLWTTPKGRHIFSLKTMGFHDPLSV